MNTIFLVSAGLKDSMEHTRGSYTKNLGEEVEIEEEKRNQGAYHIFLPFFAQS